LFDADVTVLLGGYVAAMGLAGRPRGHPCVLLESNALPGRAARFLARRSARVLLQWESALQHLPCPDRGIVTGMPVDERLGAIKREAARRSLGLEPARPTLFVLGGSQGSLAVNRLTLEALHLLGQAVAGIQVFHLAGPTNATAVRDEARSLPCPVRAEPFFADMAVAYAAADLVVARAGGMTVAELCAAGRGAILVPYPHHRDQHQLANARELEKLGAALIVREGAGGEVDRLAGHIARLMVDRDVLARMGEAARAAHRPDSLGRVADLVEELAGC
jgi:UDP-N-acetylglucosamine--N-acetylmuramyl-(pentapeptide) pyrophosphoryl-undecaprenol N-acetylglucosamine transferase